MPEPLYCWRCSQLLVDVILPLSRREECPACEADQHVCKLCRNYRPGYSDDCSEDRAEAVTDKEKANFCDFFMPVNLPSHAQSKTTEQQAVTDLNALFGDSLSEPTASKPTTKTDQLLAELNDLFNKD